MKDKTITFRHLREIKCLPDTLPKEQLISHLVENELNRGYVPMGIKFERVKKYIDGQIGTMQYDTAYCYSGYAGKKMARVFYNKNRKMLEKPNYDTIHVL